MAHLSVLSSLGCGGSDSAGGCRLGLCSSVGGVQAVSWPVGGAHADGGLGGGWCPPSGTHRAASVPFPGAVGVKVVAVGDQLGLVYGEPRASAIALS